MPDSYAQQNFPAALGDAAAMPVAPHGIIAAIVPHLPDRPCR